MKFTKFLFSCVDATTPSTHASPSTATKERPPFKAMRKVVYHLIKDAELKKMLKAEGLSVKGNRKILEWRHKRFAVLWNSQANSDRPASRMALVMDLEREERRLNEAHKESSNPKSASTSANTSILQFDRNSDPAVISQRQSEYLSKNKNSFQQLVQQIKQRKENLPPMSTSSDNQQAAPEKNGTCKMTSLKSPKTISDGGEEEKLTDFNLPSAVKPFEEHTNLKCSQISASGHNFELAPKSTAIENNLQKSSLKPKYAGPSIGEGSDASIDSPANQLASPNESVLTKTSVSSLSKSVINCDTPGESQIASCLKDLVSDTVAEICASFEDRGQHALEKKHSTASSEDLFEEYTSQKINSACKSPNCSLPSPHASQVDNSNYAENTLSRAPSIPETLPGVSGKSAENSEGNESVSGNTSNDPSRSSKRKAISNDEDSDDDFVPSTQRKDITTPKKRSCQTPKSATKKQKTSTNKGKSECPACGKYVPTHLINCHLDYCCQDQPVEVTPEIIEEDGDDFVVDCNPTRTRTRKVKLSKS